MATRRSRGKSYAITQDCEHPIGYIIFTYSCREVDGTQIIVKADGIAALGSTDHFAERSRRSAICGSGIRSSCH